MQFQSHIYIYIYISKENPLNSWKLLLGEGKIKKYELKNIKLQRIQQYYRKYHKYNITK